MPPLRARLAVHLPARGLIWWLEAWRRPRAFTLGLVLVPLAVVLTATYTVHTALWRQQALRRLHVTAQLAGRILEESFTDTWHFERIITSQPAFLEAARRHDASRLNGLLQDAVAMIPRVDLALFISPQGRVVASSGDPSWLGRDVSSEDSFQGANQPGGWRAYVSAVSLREGAPLEKVVGVVWPVTQHGELLGVLQAQYRVETIRVWLAKIRVEPSGFLYLVDHRDQLVVYPFQVLPGRPKVVSKWPPVAHPLPPDGSTMTFIGGRKAESWLAGMVPIGPLGWRVVAVQSDAAALQPLRGVFWTLAGLLGLLAAVTLAVGWRWAQVQSTSLRLLQHNTKLLRQLHQRKLLERRGGNKATGAG